MVGRKDSLFCADLLISTNIYFNKESINRRTRALVFVLCKT